MTGRRPRRLFAGLLLILALAVGVLVGHGLALAHASLVKSVPAANARLQDPPSSVQLWFSEAVEARSSRIAVFDGSRQRGDRRKVAALPGDPKSIRADLETLAPGSYSVAWQVMSAVDSHVSAGSFQFSVGPAAAAPAAEALLPAEEEGVAGVPSPLEVLVRWINLMVSAVVFSGFAMALLCRKAAERAGSAPQEASLELVRKQLRGTAGPALATAVAAVPVSLLLQATSLGDTSLSSLFALVSETRFGLVWLGRAAVAAALVAVLHTWKGEGTGWKAVTGLGLGALLLLTFSLNGHGAALGDGGLLSLVSDWLHLITASVWVGGLIHLGRVLLQKATPGQGKRAKKRSPSKTRSATGTVDTFVVELLVVRFSTLAMISVLVLLLTGLYNSWLEVASLDSLLTTAYGRTLLMKVALSVPALGLGAVNLRRAYIVNVQARYRQAAGLPTTRAVWGEALLGIAIFLAVALLVALPPAKDALPRGSGTLLAVAKQAGEARFELEVDPGWVGRNNFRVRVQDGQGQPLNGDGRLIMRFEYLDGELESAGSYAQKAAPGEFEGTWGHLRASGRWNIETVLRRDGREDVGATFSVSVENPEVLTSPPTASTWSERGTGGEVPARLIEIELLLAGLMATGAVWVNRAALGRALAAPFSRFLKALGYDLGRPAQKEAVTALMLAGSLVAFMGFYALLGDVLALASSSGLPRNPIAPSAQSRAIGKELYARKCLGCHGLEGGGDGPLVKEYLPGLDLRPHVLAHPSGQIFVWITYGLGSEMPSFEEELSDEERWNLVNYVRTLGESSLPGFHAH